MRLFLTLALTVLIGCGDGSSNQPVIVIEIIATNPHPFLIDHDRVCIITVDGQETHRFDLYPDIGTGSTISNLYDLPEAEHLVLIDTNGTWYFINKSSGSLDRQEWHWQKKTPDHFLGTFAYSQEQRAYLLVDSADRVEGNIYLFKDPDTE
ncbi:MAG: hypothetical protein AB8C95_14255 [Phycisphaeraceae bacterium]